MGWIAIAAVVLEALGLAFGMVFWGAPALIVVGPVLLATVIVTVVLWLTVIPQRMLRAAVEGRPLRGAPAGFRAAQEFRRSQQGSGFSGSGGAVASSGSAWPSDSGVAGGHAARHDWHGSSESGWVGDSSAGDGTSSGSWSDSGSSGSSSSSSDSGSSSSSSSSSDSSSSSW